MFYSKFQNSVPDLVIHELLLLLRSGVFLKPRLKFHFVSTIIITLLHACPFLVIFFFFWEYSFLKVGANVNKNYTNCKVQAKHTTLVHEHLSVNTNNNNNATVRQPERDWNNLVIVEELTSWKVLDSILLKRGMCGTTQDMRCMVHTRANTNFLQSKQEELR